MIKDKEKTSGNATTSNVPISVTPVFRQGNTVVCDIDPPSTFKKGGNIRLPRGACTLEFSLQPGIPANLKFRTKQNGASDAFWCDSTTCPAHETLDPQYSNPQVSNGGATVTVAVNPNGQQNAVFYRLNFDNACNFDPVIIHQ